LSTPFISTDRLVLNIIRKSSPATPPFAPLSMRESIQPCADLRNDTFYSITIILTDCFDDLDITLLTSPGGTVLINVVLAAFINHVPSSLSGDDIDDGAWLHS
jgi:hypothetical protein